MEAEINQFTSLDNLEAWAYENGYTNDPHVQRRRLEIMWEELRIDLDLPDCSHETDEFPCDSVTDTELVEQLEATELAQACEDDGHWYSFDDECITDTELVDPLEVTELVQACEEDGEWYGGKVFQCPRCLQKLHGYTTMQRHKATHHSEDYQHGGGVVDNQPSTSAPFDPVMTPMTHEQETKSL